MTLETYLLDTMFEQSLFADLSLAFYHSAYPSTMRFNVHRAIVAQSSFLRLLLDNTHKINTADTSRFQQELVTNNTSQQSHRNHSTVCNSNVLHLTIDIIEAMSLRGFLMAPSQHIIRRQWQSKTPRNTAAATNIRTNNNSNHTTRHILSSHIRFVLKWLYCTDRTPLVESLQDDDILRILCVAILFDLDPLVNACLERYTNQQMSVYTIVGDLEIIRQLPRDHRAYHQLRDAALLLLFRFGPDHPQQVACLSVDYMVDVLSADVLFIGCEYERYRLLREVLVAYMKSVGKITWTVTGPLDQDYKRLSGFVHNPIFTQNQHQQQQQQKQQQHTSLESVGTLFSAQKRRLDESSLSPEPVVNRVAKKQHLSRLSFSSRVPFEELVEDACSSGGGVIDKATILSYLLRTTVNYSNMTFEQLSVVRQDRIVDEGIVFKALWQREALERLLFPFHYEQSQQIPNTHSPSLSTPTPAPVSSQLVIPPFRKTDISNRMDRQESTTTTSTSDQVKEDQDLLAAPRYRFAATVRLKLPVDGDLAGWTLEQHADTESITTSTLGRTLSDTSQLNSNTSADHSIVLDQKPNNDDDSDADEYNFDIDNEDMEALLNCDPTINFDGQLANIGNKQQEQQERHQQQQYSGRIYSKIVYTDATYILGQWHRVRLEAQVLPRCLLQIENDDEDSGSEIKRNDSNNNKDDSPVLVCRFELQRTLAVRPSTSSQQQQLKNTQHRSVHPITAYQKSPHNNNQSPNNSQRSVTSQQPQETTTSHSLSSSQRSIMSIPNHSDSLEPLPPLPSHYREPAQQDSKIRYSIYCLNQHEGLMKNDQVDPEDRVLVPVSEVVEGNQSSSYIGQVLLNTDALENKNIIDVDMMVALEIIFTKRS